MNGELWKPAVADLINWSKRCKTTSKAFYGFQRTAQKRRTDACFLATTNFGVKLRDEAVRSGLLIACCNYAEKKAASPRQLRCVIRRWVLISCQRHLLPVFCTPLLAFPSSIRLHADWLGCKYTCTLMSNRTMNANMYRWQRIESLKYTCRRSVERRDHRANAEFCAWPCGPKVLIERCIIWNA